MSENPSLGLDTTEVEAAPDVTAPEPFGAGLLGDDGALPSVDDANREDAPAEPGTEETAVEPSFDPENFDLINTDLEQLPPEFHGAKKWATGARAAQTRAMQALADERRQVQELYQQVQQQQQQQQQAPQEQDQGPTAYEQLRSQAVDIDQARGLDNVNMLVQETVAPYQQRIDYLESVVGQLQQQTQQYDNFMQTEATKTHTAIVEELDAVREKHPDVDNYQPGIVSLYNKQVNPETKKPYTIEEAYMEASGKAPLARLQKQQQAQAGRQAAKQNATPNPAASAGPGAGGGALTSAQAISEIGNLGGFQ